MKYISIGVFILFFISAIVSLISGVMYLIGEQYVKPVLSGSALVFIAIITIIVILHMLGKSPLLSLNSMEELKLIDEGGSCAEYSSKWDMIAVRPDVFSYRWPLDTTGTVKDVCATLDGESIKTKLESVRGTVTEYQIDFGSALDWLKTRYELTKSCVFENTFVGRDEKFLCRLTIVRYILPFKFVFQ